MNKSTVKKILSLMHLILWSVFLLASVIMRFAYRAPDLEPLDYALSKGMYNIFIIVAVAGVTNATVLFLSVRAVSLHLNTKGKGKRAAALCISAIATILYYTSVALIFLVNTDIVVIASIAWFLCELCCGILLSFSGNR